MKLNLKRLHHIILGIALMTMPSISMADGWTSYGEVTRVGASSSVVKIYLSVSGSWGTSCQGSSYRVSQSEPMANHAMSIALAAFTAKKRVRVKTSGCSGSSVRIEDIEIQH